MIVVEDLGLMRYREAWRRQEERHAAVLDGAEERLLLVEHPPVITFGRRPASKNVVASREHLDQLGVEIVESDRGGDVTFHGPGQLVAYPIIRLADHRLSVGAYVHRLEDAVITALSAWGLQGQKDPTAVGIWVEHEGTIRKICALGVRIRRGVSMHGIALNVTIDLNWFNLIIPCGLAGKPVTSLAEVMRSACPDMSEVKRVMEDAIQRTFGA